MRLECTLSRFSLLGILVLGSIGFIGSPVSFAQTGSPQERRAWVAKFPGDGNLKVSTSGQYDEVIVMQEPTYTPDDAAATLNNQGLQKVASTTWFPLGFKRVVVTNGKKQLASASISYDGFRDITVASNAGGNRLNPSEALAAARAEVAKGAGGSPKMIYTYACQVPPSSTEYPEAQSLIKANDRLVRAMGMLNDFLVPLHEACDKVGRGKADPSVIGTIQPGHLAFQDTKSLSEEATASGYTISYTLCGDPNALCGTLTAGNPRSYADKLFSDRELASHLSLLGYSAVMFRTNDPDESKRLFFGMNPSKDGWVAMEAPRDSVAPVSTSSTPSDSGTFHLTNTYSSTRVSMLYPSDWKVGFDKINKVTTIQPIAASNKITLSNGDDWYLEGAWVGGADKIVILEPFLKTLSDSMFKEDPRAKENSIQRTTIGGRPAVLEEYTTSSAVDSHQEWGMLLATNSSSGVVVLRMYCPTEKRAECSTRFTEMLHDMTVK